jgi:Protein of unknown function (DUF3592)
MSETTASRRFVYKSKAQSRLQPYLYLAGGLVCVAVAVAGFILCVTRRPEHRIDPFAQYSMTTLPILIALGAFSYAVVLFRTPRRIELSIDGILLESPLKRRAIDWDQIDHVETDKKLPFIPGVEVEILILRDAAGAKLAVLSSAVKDFVNLSERVQRIVTKRTGHATVSAKARRSKRAALFFLAFGVLMVAISISVGYGAWIERTNRNLLESDGVDTQATIVKHYMYNGIWPWVEYTFRDTTGREFARRVMLETPAWQALEGAKTVPVRYIRSNPDYSRVDEGEESSMEHDPRIMLLLAPAVGLFSLLFFLVGILRWKGLDVTFDEKKFRFRMKRLGAAPDDQTSLSEG